MRSSVRRLAAVAVVIYGCSFAVLGQGTFENLDFESASVAGYSVSGAIPISDALPGWSGSIGGTPTSEVSYDAISLGETTISVIDDNALIFSPLQGSYSVMMFAGVVPEEGINFELESAAISQTAVVPAGTRSLLMDAYVAGTPFYVTLGGQLIYMTPLEAFPNSGSYPPYTLYGANIPSSFAGQTETLTITDPAPASFRSNIPNELELDSISFSPSSIPEPSPLALVAIGGGLFGCQRKLARKRPMTDS
jgi:hypothetical protein